MAAPDQSESKPTPMIITLMVSKKGRKIMYAEARKDFVDLLFSFLMIPTGAIAKQALVSEDTKTKARCIRNLYDSVQNMSPSLLTGDKATLLDPKVVSTTYTNDILRIQSPPPPPPPAAPPRYYVCYGCVSNAKHGLSTKSGAHTCFCGRSVDIEVEMLDTPPVTAKDPVLPTGYVKKNANFVITDDLTVISANSTATIVQLWNKLGVQEPTELEERTVTVGPNEVMGLLRAAMVSNTALNDVFKAGPKYSTAVDRETTGISLQELLIKLLTEDQKHRSSSKLTV
uniref:DUF674 domain-containing protein n=1 Tax=Picea sitchensis TaxID=3332 RepID=B8LN76_PICSI|nr:unknown [Picea sitchensis]